MCHIGIIHFFPSHSSFCNGTHLFCIPIVCKFVGIYTCHPCEIKISYSRNEWETKRKKKSLQSSNRMFPYPFLYVYGIFTFVRHGALYAVRFNLLTKPSLWIGGILLFQPPVILYAWWNFLFIMVVIVTSWHIYMSWWQRHPILMDLKSNGIGIMACWYLLQTDST